MSETYAIWRAAAAALGPNAQPTPKMRLLVHRAPYHGSRLQQLW